MKYIKIIGVFICIVLTITLLYYTTTNNNEFSIFASKRENTTSEILKTNSTNIDSIDAKEKDIAIQNKTKDDKEESVLDKQSNMLDVDPMFRQIKTFVLFIGYARSGSSLTATILDAHKHVVISHEITVLDRLKERLKKNKVTRNDFFQKIYQVSSKQSKYLRAEHGHFGIWNYYIPNTYLGTYKNYIQVIGDKRAQVTTQIMSKTYENFELFQEIIKLPVKFVHVVRNPYDIIATTALREKGLRKKRNDLAKDAEPLNIPIPYEGVLELIKMNSKLRQKFGNRVLDVNYSHLSTEPGKSLLRICNFLNIECDEDYIKACSEKINPEESYTRRYLVWPDSVKSEVNKIIQNTDFLQGFTFEK